MRFSIWPDTTRPWDEILDLVQHCERTGWDGVCFADHFMPNGPDSAPLDGDVIECWSVLAALAASIPRIRLKSLVTSVTYRHPAVIAKAAAAVDLISQGRLVLGLGAGWQENEHVSYGLALGTTTERLDRLEEAVQIIISMLRQPRTTFAGKYFQVTDAPNQRVPAQERVPILIGGRGERRTMALAARWADEWNSWTTPEILAHKVGVLVGHCEHLGRDPEEIQISTQALLFLSSDETWLAERRRRLAEQPTIVGTAAQVLETIGRYRDAGANEVIIPAATLGGLSRARDTCDYFMEEVAAKLR
jgi:F420-dependent oxidoreductase-like protein